MAGSDIPLDSDALRANIAGTAQQVEIPEAYLPLLDAVADLHGVRESLRETLEEYFHGYRNTDAVVDGLQNILLRNWSYFERTPARQDHFERLGGLTLDLLASDIGDQQASRLVRVVLAWWNGALHGPHPEAYLGSIAGLGARLGGLLSTRSAALLERAGLLRDTLLRLQAQTPAAAPAVKPLRDLYLWILRLGFERAAERLDVAAWAGTREAKLNDPAAVERHFVDLRVERLAGLADKAGRAYARATFPAGSDPLLDLPAMPDLIDHAIATVFKLDDVEDRFSVCLFILKDGTLGYRQHEVMVDLLAVVKNMMDPSRHTDADRLLTRLTHFFHVREGLYPEMRFQCYEAIGVAIGAQGTARAADHLTNDLLSWRFEYPELRGATDDWQTVVNPYHMPNTRCWLRIIESNPTLYERLAAALTTQLRVGGVFIADTDLFQRDITRFLNADIRSIYPVAKQLLRTFPVYFNEVGAEGELRSVSTEIDEICGRRDTLMHFLRKQAHAESSNRLVDFSQAVLDYWRTLDVTPLAPFLSDATMAAVRAERAWAEGPHGVLAGAPAEPESRRDGSDARRVELMQGLRRLLLEKYSPSGGDLGRRVEAELSLSAEVRRRFAEALAAWEVAGAGAEGSAAGELGPADLATTDYGAELIPGDHAAERDRLLDAALEVLEGLKQIILSPTPSQGVENIYHKRHIAAGIPSMYGSYTEPKFDALGLTFRMESLLTRLLEEAADADAMPEYLTRATLRRMAATLRRFERALAVDGTHSQSLSSNLRLLEASTEHTTLTFHQYENVFRFIAQSVSDLARLSVLSHDQALRTILEADPRQCEIRGLSADAVAEVILRDVLVSGLGLQTLDRYVSSGLRRVSALRGRLADDDLTRMMSYDPERLVSFIHEADADSDDQITLGYKALGLKHLAQYGHQVPEGFILTTELFGAMPAMSYQPLYEDTIARVRSAVERLEAITGLRLGDPEQPLTLSIRSGAAISLPGLMLTFINVGLNEAITRSLARRKGFAWTAWDSYRRFLQTWAMAAGVDRDVFDGIMADHKTRWSVLHKADFTPSQMREVALTYKEEAVYRGVLIIDDPFDQLVACVRSVVDSWDSAQARLFREYLNVAQEWGTAVIVQRMVLGNRSLRSGAGVTFTRDPLGPHSRQVRLFGDFAVCSQGEDLVGGLVFPLPISEAQRRQSPAYREVNESLEKGFPEVYAALLGAAEDLVVNRGYDPQELEFTFESPAAADLYLLQKRPMVQGPIDEMPVFDTMSCPQCDLPVAVGMGVAGGAFAGRVVMDAGQIDRFLAEDPSGPLILLRPDTVPEDLPLIVRTEGLLTARGGATSHAAVTAKRLGKTAVVDCRALHVHDGEGVARLGARELAPGDWLSIDGRTGRIFLGRLDIINPAGNDASVGASAALEGANAAAEDANAAAATSGEQTEGRL